MIYFTADQHYYHKNVIKYEDRPFKTIDEMNQTMIQNHNSIISNNDEVYMIGDIGFCQDYMMKSILKQLNGIKYLIKGNHDKFGKSVYEEFVWVKDYYKLKYNNEKFILFHYPIYAWDCKHHGSYHIHGHVHTTSHNDFFDSKKFNVGVDCTGFKPVSIEKILQGKII